VSLRSLWARMTGEPADARRERLARAIAAVGPLSDEPGFEHFSTSEKVDDHGEAIDLSVLVVSDAYDPRWIDVTRKEGDTFTTYRYRLLPEGVDVVRQARGDIVDVQADAVSDRERAWRLFDLGLDLLHRHCAARDAAHTAWRTTIDRASATMVIEALFGPWDYACRAAMATFERFTGADAPGVPVPPNDLNPWLWMNVMLQGQRTGRPLVEFLVENDGRWVASRCREQKEPTWAREFAPRNERKLKAPDVQRAFDAFLAERGWRLVMYDAELGKPLSASDASKIITAARRAGFDGLSILPGPFSGAANRQPAPRSRGPRPPGPSSPPSSP
jgi:hypothetical protein